MKLSIKHDSPCYFKLILAEDLTILIPQLT